MDAVVETTDTAVEPTNEHAQAAHVGGKYLTFLLDGEEYGVEILKVREINGMMDITRVPQTPDFVEGVINLRGRVIPVLDLRLRFGLARCDYTDQTCIIVIDIGTQIGIIVDTVQEVHDISASDIEPPPRLGSAVDTSFIRGMGKVNDKVKILLDIDNVLTSAEMVELTSMDRNGATEETALPSQTA